MFQVLSKFMILITLFLMSASPLRADDQESPLFYIRLASTVAYINYHQDTIEEYLRAHNVKFETKNYKSFRRLFQDFGILRSRTSIKACSSIIHDINLPKKMNKIIDLQTMPVSIFRNKTLPKEVPITAYNTHVAFGYTAYSHAKDKKIPLVELSSSEQIINLVITRDIYQLAMGKALFRQIQNQTDKKSPIHNLIHHSDIGNINFAFICNDNVSQKTLSSLKNVLSTQQAQAYIADRIVVLKRMEQAEE
ncbi:hypothetical protein QGN29_01810 [Temperatibacter marinus]|uniref:Solute-binding protein family 3/N-terminal domain-containing protein n=1 Tax=Temperatibacter marinus TaxID=1456591 RepID=A0AA52EHX7_9PROT|nr:hypothetical protein [Temperatibacter marinus]WND03100.1 hypothetical protein QGN29_01810 [Temperatibacter marinus]